MCDLTTMMYILALADGSVVMFRTLPLMLGSSIPSAAADFANACTDLCLKIVLC